VKANEFDRALMEEMAQLPPGPEAIDDYTPWQASIHKILWGMGLTTFKFEFFYLQYLLPLLGAVLLYLGYRSLRRDNRWFRLCWIISGFLLIWHILWDVLAATPLLTAAAARPALNGVLTGLSVSVNLLLLFSLRQGIRNAFSAGAGGRPKDWMGLGLAAYLLSLAVALWSELVPLTKPSMFGMTIIHQWLWLHYARGIAFIALQIFLLVCIARQGGALAGRGYRIAPVPIRVPGRIFLAAVFLFTAAAVFAASFFSSRPPMPPAQSLSQLQQNQDWEVRGRLEELGMAPELAALLDSSELARCRKALAVLPLTPSNERIAGQEGEEIWLEGRNARFTLDGGTVRLTVHAVPLPGRQIRYYQFFQWEVPPTHSYQESFTASLHFYPGYDFSSRLAWQIGGQSLTAPLPVHLGGGQTPEELPAWALEWYGNELAALGHLQDVPYIIFSIPRNAAEMQGWLAWTMDQSQDLNPDETEFFYTDPILHHQTSWPLFPFQSISHIASTTYNSFGKPFPGLFASFESGQVKAPW